VPAGQLARRTPQRQRTSWRGLCRQPVLMAADAGLRLAWLDLRAGTHRGHRHSVAVQQLEIHEPVRRHLETRRAVRLDRHRSQNPLYLEPGPRDRRAVERIADVRSLSELGTAPERPGPDPFLDRFHHPQAGHVAAPHALHVRPLIHVGHVHAAGVAVIVPPLRNHRRTRVRGQRQRVETSGLLAVQQDFVAEYVDQIQPHHQFVQVGRVPDRLVGGHRLDAARHQEVLSALPGAWVHQRKRILVARPQRHEMIADERLHISHQRPGACGPDPHHCFLAVQALAPFHNGQRPPRAVVAGTKDADHLVRAGDRPAVEHGWRTGHVVGPVESVAGPVRVHRPQPLRIAVVAVHVFPAVVQHAPVRQQAGVALEQRALADLVDVCAVAVHPVQVRHDVHVAVAVFRLTRAGEDDLPVRQIQRIDVRRVPLVRQSPQTARHGRPALLRVHLQFVNRVVLVPRLAHREDDLPPVEMHFRVAHESFGTGIEQHGSLSRNRVQDLQGAAGPVIAAVRFAGVENRFRVVMVRQILLSHHKQDRLRSDQRIGEQRRALQLFERRARAVRSRSHLLLDCVQLPEQLLARRILRPKVADRVANRRPQRRRTAAVGQHARLGLPSNRGDRQSDKQEHPFHRLLPPAWRRAASASVPRQSCTRLRSSQRIVLVMIGSPTNQKLYGCVV